MAGPVLGWGWKPWLVALEDHPQEGGKGASILGCDVQAFWLLLVTKDVPSRFCAVAALGAEE